MRLAALTVLMGVLSVVPAFACGAPQVIPTSQTFVPTILVYDKGWVIPGLAGASVLRRYRDETGSEVLVYRTTTQVEVRSRVLRCPGMESPSTSSLDMCRE